MGVELSGTYWLLFDEVGLYEEISKLSLSAV